jgi:5-methylcytosine-specific restriction endonuclease McrA
MARGHERVRAEDIRKIGEAQGWRCACGCGRPIRDGYHLDHRRALARGGTHSVGNLQLLSPVCNLRKGSR